MSKIQITDLIDNAVENAIARRKEALTTEEAKQVKGGANFSIASNTFKLPSPIIAGGIITTCGMICPPDKIMNKIMKF